MNCIECESDKLPNGEEVCILPNINIDDINIDDILNKVEELIQFKPEDIIELYGQFYDKLYCQLEEQYKKNRIVGEEYSRFLFDFMNRSIELATNARLSAFQTAVSSIDSIIRAYTLKYTIKDELLKTKYEIEGLRYDVVKLKKACELTDKQRLLICEQIKSEKAKNGNGNCNNSIYQFQKETAVAQAKLYHQQRKSFRNKDKANILAEYNKTWISAMSEGSPHFPVTYEELSEKLDETFYDIWTERDYELRNSCY
jgi:hypothetical protein